MKKTIIFFVNGLGLGNSTRCLSIINSIKTINKKIKIIVATSGNGYWYFKNRKNVDALYKMKQVKYKKKSGKLSALGTVLGLKNILNIFNSNTNSAINLINQHNPKCVITDSFYFFPKIKKKKKFVFMSLNNSDYVFEKFFKSKKKPVSIYPQFFFVELLDYLYNLNFHDFVISPCFVKKAIFIKNKIYRIPPVIRSGLKINKKKKFNPIIMLSGSTFSTQLNEKSEFVKKFSNIHVLGRNSRGKSKKFNYIGKLKNNSKTLNKYNAAIINAGFSALSEVYLLKKPAIIVPVPNHSEQFFNAKSLEEMGLAIFSDEKDIFKNLDTLKKKFKLFNQKYSKIKSLNGSNIAANFILNKI